MENNSQPLTVSELQRAFSEIGGKVIWALLPVIIYASAQLFRLGNISEHLVLLLGSIVTILAMFGYVGNELTNGVKRKKGLWAMLLSIGGFIPWAFGSYLCLYKGLWSFTHLLNGLTLITLLEAVIFTYLGYKVVSNFHKMTEIGEIIRKGEVEILDK